VAEVGFCDCAGLAALIRAHHALTDAGARPVVIGAGPQLQRLVEAADAQWLFAPVDLHRPDAA
jgi:anti-anti-sigma regulatory factor